MLQTNQKDYNKTEYIALYCRVATINQQADDLLIEAQKQRLIEWAFQHGYKLEQVDVILEIGFSGQTLNRPGIQQILSGPRKYSAVVAVKSTRFAATLLYWTNSLIWTKSEKQHSILWTFLFP